MRGLIRTELHDSALNSPYEAPREHWAQDQNGRLTAEKRPGRRPSEIKTIIVPQADGVSSSPSDEDMLDEVQSETNRLINQVRGHLDAWRKLPLGSRGVTDTTRKLLQYWSDPDREFKLFFCQLEAIETLIWLAEVAPRARKRQPGLPSGEDIIKKLERFAEADASALLLRVATKMATGTGKTTVMAMIIAWHYLNHGRNRNPRFCYANQFLVITPGITIKNRLEVLLPEVASNEYQAKDLIPPEFRSRGNGMVGARVIVANYHKLIPQKLEKIHANTKAILGKDSPVFQEESPRAVLARLLGAEALRPGSPLLVLNDEAHHCYRSRSQSQNQEPASDGPKRSKKKASSDDDDGLNLKEEETRARVWLSGIEALAKELKPKRQKKNAWRLTVHDLSATPFYLRGSGHPEGTLFPWVVSDFSLLDAIESGLVKLPRVPVKDTSPQKIPVFREVYKHIRHELPGSKSGSKSGSGKKLSLSHGERAHPPALLEEALKTLYERYKETYETWQGHRQQGESGESHGTEPLIPPVFLVICNNTSLSRIMYDYIAGYSRKDGSFQEGNLALFSQDPQHGGPLRTLLVDSQQLQKLESGEKASVDPEHEHFRKHIKAFLEKKREAGALNEAELGGPGGAPGASPGGSLGEILRKTVNTVGKSGELGEQIRCLIAVSMLTEGWDANNVTHILGIRSFGTRLLCEQIVGRGLRRMSYSLDEMQRFSAEYVDIFGIPFDFAPNSSAPSVPKGVFSTAIHAVPEKERFALCFPKVVGYTLENKKGRLVCRFDPEGGSRYDPDPSQTPEKTTIQGIKGQSQTVSLEDKLANTRDKDVILQLANKVLELYLQGETGEKNASFGRARIFTQLYPHVEHWYWNIFDPPGQITRKHLDINGTYMAEAAHTIYKALLPMAEEQSPRRVIPLLKSGEEEGSTHDVHYRTSRDPKTIWSGAEKSHLNKAVTDSGWEYVLCKMLEENEDVLAWARNSRSLDFSIPYAYQGDTSLYYPDFIARIRTGLQETVFYIIETKGEYDDRDRAKAETVRRQWLPAVNAWTREDPLTGISAPRWGRWEFVEFKDINQFRQELAKITAIPRRHRENTAS